MQENQQDSLLKLVADLSARLETQEQRLKDQEKELATFRQVSTPAQPVAETSTSRRRLLKKVGLMAAGAAVAVTAGTTLNPTTSEAATGGNLLIGKVNYPTTSGDTTLVRTPVVFNGLAPSLVQANNIGIGVSGFKVDEEPSISTPGKDNNWPPKYGTPAGLKIAITGITLGSDPHLPDIRNKVGVFGLSDTGKGVLGAATSGEGVFGTSGGGAGVYGESTSGVGGVFKGNRAPLRLIPATTAGAPTTNSHDVGELYVDKDGKLYICTASGMPGTWHLLS